MKINSHIIGYIIGGAAIYGLYWFVDKEKESYRSFRIMLRKGKYRASDPSGTVESPEYATADEAKGWVDVRENTASAIPWGN